MKVVSSETLQVNTPTKRSWSLRGWHLDGLVLLLFVVLTVFMTWPVAPNMGRSLQEWGDALLQTWTLDWDAHAFLSDPLHLANANAFYPYQNSLAFSETLVGQALLVAPVIWLTGNPVLGYNLLLLGSFVLCGWGAYLLAKELTGSRVAGLAAGMIFAFFPNRFVQLSHLHLLSAEWMPFSLLFLHRFLRQRSGKEIRDQRSEIGKEDLAPEISNQALVGEEGPKAAPVLVDKARLRWWDGALFGLFFGLELLSSTYLGLFLMTVVGLYLLYYGVGWLGRLRQGTVKFGWRQNKAIALCIILIVTGLIVLPFYLPYLSVQQDLGFERSASEVQSFSAQPFYYLDVPKENKLNASVYQSLFKQAWWEGSGGERGLYLGLLALLLGGLGVVVVWRWRRQVPDGPFYVLLALMAFSFTFGPLWQTGRFGAIPLPYAVLYNYVPGFAAIRVPVRFIYVVALAVAVLAAFGTAWLLQRRWLAGPSRAAAVGLVIVLLMGGEYWSNVEQQVTDTLRNPPPAAEQWLDAHPAPALHVPLSGSDSTNLFWQYWTRASWRPVMNGFSGFMPPAYDALKSAVASEGFSPRILQMLQGLEVRYLEIDTTEATVKPQWARLKAGLDKFGATQAAAFGDTLIYQLPSDPWLTNLKTIGIGSDSLLYFVEYHRTSSPLLELTASYLESSGRVRRENLYGAITVGFRALPALPAGRPADFLMLPAAEDPTLYGFASTDRVFGNDLLAVYKKNSNLLARYDFTRQAAAGMLNRTAPLTITPDGNGLKFGGTLGQPVPDRILTLGLAALQPQKLTLQTSTGTQTLDLQPGLSTYRLALSGGVTLSSDQKFSVAWAELRQGSFSATAEAPVLRTDVVLLSSQAHFEAGSGMADIGVVGPKIGQDYTATLDVYNTPWGVHPNGHYGYWSVPVPSGSATQTEWRLDLVHKTMTTLLNGGNVPNYPPDLKQFDITRYGNLGDFRANLNLYVGNTLIGSAKLFDFTVWTEGDKNRIENRRAGAFTGYNNDLEFLVLPPAP